ncbi:MAG: HEAT repeat domain-containing protein [Spirulina sp. SIO3F2]|nr:HEAT repeat domain-containing protein [Spirulina sp. SIO3F2]
MVSVEAQFPQEPQLLSPEATDEFVQSVNEQIAQGTLDIDEPLLLKQLIECLGDTRGMTRLSIVELLGELGTVATPYLQESLAHHENPTVRRSSAKTLAAIADPTAVPALIQALLTDADAVVRGSSAGALAKMGETAVQQLLQILESPDYPGTIKGQAAWALGFIGRDAQPYLTQALSSNSPEVRAAIVGAIESVARENPSEGMEDLLINALSDPAEMVRCEAAAALGTLAYQPALPILVELLEHIDWETRRAAALSIMKIGDPQAIAALETARDRESEAAVETVLKLAISQLKQRL